MRMDSGKTERGKNTFCNIQFSLCLKHCQWWFWRQMIKDRIQHPSQWYYCSNLPLKLAQNSKMDKFRFNFGETENNTNNFGRTCCRRCCGYCNSCKKKIKELKFSSKDNVPCKQRLNRNFWSIITFKIWYLQEGSFGFAMKSTPSLAWMNI